MDRVAIDGRGPEGDRRWMITEPDGAMVTRRRDASLARVLAERTANGVRLSDDRGAIAVPTPTSGARRVRIWRDTCDAYDAGDPAAEWLTSRLGRPVRLVALAETDARATDPAHPPTSGVGFADGFPLLVVSGASLRAIEARTGVTDILRRLRPKVVIDGGSGPDAEPFAEDSWGAIRVGDITLELVKPCSRCVMVNVDPDTGESDPSLLRGLATFRRTEDGIFAGQNAVASGTGHLQVGADVTIVRRHSPRPSLGIAS